MVTRRPKGYIGTNHETIGSDILSVLKVIHLPERVLGPTLAQKLAEVRADSWHPISLLLEPLELVSAQFGAPSLVSMGWALFKLSHEQHAKQTNTCARDVIYGMDAIYHRANRGIGIGGWTVTSFKPGQAELSKTTPHHCALEEGILEKALLTAGVPAQIRQTRCFQKGADDCHFVITSIVTGSRWAGKEP